MSDDIDRAVDETRAFLAARPVPDLTGSVMERIAAVAPLPARQRGGMLPRVVRWLWLPREMSVRPALALAAFAVVAVLALASRLQELSPSGPAGDAVREPQVFVQFRLEANASRVQLAGSFTNWEPRYEMWQSVPGVWTITVPLAQGVHDYAFVVDGDMWVPDPYAPQIGDGFGGTNSRLALLAPNTPQL
jgi:hypothetical protein